MLSVTYRFKVPIAVVIRDARGYRLRELPAGSLFLPAGSRPDPSGMIDGTCNGDVVLIFARDLDERAERISSAPKQHIPT